MAKLTASFTMGVNHFLESLREEVGRDERSVAPSPSPSKRGAIASRPKVRRSTIHTERPSIEQRVALANENKKNKGTNAGRERGAASLALTEEEERDNKIWRMRLISEEVFGRRYEPTWWERREMDSIVEFLALEDPTDHPEFLNKDEQQVTKTAVRSIFFPKSGERKSVLLKRGPVLLGGEERELMLFTGGFVLSHVEVGSLVNLLLDETSRGKIERLTSEKLDEQFRSIDADVSGSLDRSEIQDFFRRAGMTLSEAVLDDLMAELDADSDGTISIDEFKSAFELQMRNRAVDNVNNLRSSWILSSWNDHRKDVTNKNGGNQKLDVAFQMSDVETVDMIDGKELTLAVYLKGAHVPLLVTCAKPAHVGAWEEAFRKCMQMQGADGIETDERGNVSPEEWQDSRIDWGFDS